MRDIPRTKRPLVSVIIPTFNRSDLLRRALASLQAQTARDYEAIVVDDDSTENIQAVVDEFDERFRCLHLASNMGASSARNLGIEQSAGEYIGFLDSDDEWLPSKLEKQLSSLLSSTLSKVGAVYCGKQFVRSNGAVSRQSASCRGNIFWHLLGFDDDIQLTSSSILVTREVIDEGFRFDEALPSFQDWDFLTQIGRSYSIEVTAEPLVVQHRDHNDSHVWRHSTVPMGLEIVSQKYQKELSTRPSWKARILFRAALAQHLEGNASGLRRFLWLSYKSDPNDLRTAFWLLASIFGGRIGFRVALRLVSRRRRPRLSRDCQKSTMGRSQRLRVCLVSTDFPPAPGGVGNHVLNLARALSKRGHDVTVVTSRPDRSFMTADLDGTIRILRIRTGYHGSRWVFPALATLVNRKVDIVHWHVAHRQLDTKAAKWMRAKGKVFTNHTSEFVASARDRSEPLERYLMAMGLADRVIVPSRELGEISSSNGIAGSSIRHIPNGVDISKFDVASDSARADKGPSVVTVRRLVAKNGVDVLIRAWPLVLQEHPSARLTIAGDGPERLAIESLARSLGVTDSIDLCGNVPNDEIPSILSAADIFVIPSRIEATSIACLEAMAARLPVVGTNVGGIPELVSEGMTGLLVPPDEPKLLAGAVNRLLSDPDLRTRLGRNGRERVENNFSWDEVAIKTEAVYRETFADSSSGPRDP